MKKKEMSTIRDREQVLRNRSEMINRLRGRPLDFRVDRVEECTKAVIESYDQSTISKKIANVIRERHMEAFRFRSFGYYHAINLSEFVDESYYWEPYFSDIGRKIAQSERQYIHKQIARIVRGGIEKISRSRPNFSVLNATVKELRDKNLKPDIILAPVEMLPSFTMHFKNNLDWSQTEEQLFIEDCKLRIIWSHRYAQLRSFLVFNSKASTWFTLPDDNDNEHTITVVFGKSEQHPNLMEYWIEVIAYYKVQNPIAFRRINLYP